jgi:hypothetical protein
MLDSYLRGLTLPLRTIALGIPVAALSFAAPPLISDAKADERVQLQVFVVKAQRTKTKRVDKVPITVILSVKNTKHANYVCSLAPRVRDSLLADLRRRQFSRNRKGKIHMVGLDSQLKPLVTKALRWDIVRKVEVVEGIPKVSSASAAIFSRIGCIQMVDRSKYAGKNKAAKKK